LRATSLLLLAALLWTQPVRAQDTGRAALVVVRGDDTVERSCVTFEGETANGYDLLVRAGFDVSSEQTAMGASICALDGEGCAFPREACFCQCQGRECTYWSYWQQDEGGAWQYSGAGAANTRVRDGAVEGWVWGPGSVAEAPAPPPVTFAEICPAEAAGALETTAVSAAALTATAATTVTLAAAPAAEALGEPNGAQWGGLLLAALPLPLLVIGYLIWRRRQ
jgi:hypothetical protein